MFKKISFIVKFFLKGCYINDLKSFDFHESSWIGRGVSVYIAKNEEKEKSRIKLGKSVKIGNYSELSVWNSSKIEIKDYSTLSTNCKIIGDVTIERYCVFSANIFISSGNHYFSLNPPLIIREQDKLASVNQSLSDPVHIEEDVWIGYGVFIKRGVKIGRGAIIGSNSVVLSNVPPYEIYAGNPARFIRKRLKFTPTSHICASNSSHLPYFYKGFKHHSLSSDKGILANKIAKVILSPIKEIDKKLFIEGAAIDLNINIEVKVYINSIYLGCFVIPLGKDSFRRDFLISTSIKETETINYTNTTIDLVTENTVSSEFVYQVNEIGFLKI